MKKDGVSSQNSQIGPNISRYIDYMSHYTDHKPYYIRNIWIWIFGNYVYYLVAHVRYTMYLYFYSYHKVLSMTKSLDRTGTWRTYSMADGLAGTTY